MEKCPQCNKEAETFERVTLSLPRPIGRITSKQEVCPTCADIMRNKAPEAIMRGMLHE